MSGCRRRLALAATQKLMRSFETLTEQEILALAISLEEEDARIYDDFADGLTEKYPEQARKFQEMRHQEDEHRHRLLELLPCALRRTCSPHPSPGRSRIRAPPLD